MAVVAPSLFPSHYLKPGIKLSYKSKSNLFYSIHVHVFILYYNFLYKLFINQNVKNSNICKY